jgi:hypothetical protein
MAKLRGHHLICLHFYDGEGYDEPFIRNLDEVITAIEKEGVEAADGPDDVCEPCPHRQDESCTFNRTADREIREMDRRALALINLTPGKKVGWTRLRQTVKTIFPEWYATHCHLCTWRSACEKSELFLEFRRHCPQS